MESKAAAHTSFDNQEGLKAEKEKGSTLLKDFLVLIKIGIVNSNVITAFTGIWLALYFTNQHFFANLDVVLLGVIGIGMIIGGAGCLNNYIDRDIDLYMERTKKRPTVTGKVNPVRVLYMGLVMVVGGTLMLLVTSPAAALLGLFGVFAYVVMYTIWTKRKIVSNTVVGSISGAMPPLIGWAVVDPGLHPVAWGLFLLMFVWQPPHFYALAMKRMEEYRAAGIPMLPVVKGFHATKIHMLIWVALLLPIPFLLAPIGMPIVVLVTLLNIGWLYLSLKGFSFKKKFTKEEDLKWANKMFIYSLNYMTISFVMMVIVSLINLF
ncbi:heme o synthase [Pradoshia sp.]